MGHIRLLNLLKGAATLAIVRQFLKQRGLASTAGSWDEMISDRLAPPLDDGALAVNDVVALLRECEEHGRQHVFLYRLSPGYKPPCSDPARLKAALKALNLLGLLDAPRFLEMPATPQIVDVRMETEPKAAVIVKAVERREYQEFVGQTSSDGTLTKTYKTLEERAVNVARVRRDGLVEVRIFRQRNSSDYNDPLAGFLRLIKPLIDLAQCEEVSLVKAKTHIWETGPKLSGRIRINQQWARNAFGAENRLISQNPSRTLSDDNGSLSSMEAFVHVNGQHTASHVTWILEPGPPEETRNVALSGQAHEYALGQACTRDQYESILEGILKFNA